jgi:hypothetical protein
MAQAFLLLQPSVAEALNTTKRFKRMNRPLIDRQAESINKWLLVVVYYMLFPGWLLLVGGWMLWTVPDRYQAEIDFRAKALLTTGSVTQKTEKTTCSGGGIVMLTCKTECDQVQVKFTHDKGQTIQFWDSCPVFSIREKQTVSVLYDPTSLNTASLQARIDRKDSPASRARADIATGLLLLALSGLGLFVAGWSINRTAQP